MDIEDPIPIGMDRPLLGGIDDWIGICMDMEGPAEGCGGGEYGGGAYEWTSGRGSVELNEGGDAAGGEGIR